MPSLIRILDEKTINQIAAGEVIENLTSVVKELIDNAIDAKATHITVETGHPNCVLIRDNGCGMDEEDLRLALQRHATSKLNDVSDLQSLRTLGFRGEALPSIASVSKMRIHSASVHSPGILMAVVGGKICEVLPEPRQPGTTIEIEDLFYNVPVRKEFQKERLSDITQLIIQGSLSCPTIAFTWTHANKQQLKLNKNETFSQRVIIFFGKELTVPIQSASEMLTIEGFISPPNIHRPNRRGQYLFLNKRIVENTFISHAVRAGYGVRLPPHRYPLFALHVNVPPHWVDVNVHPQKKEVRLRNTEVIEEFILNAVDKALQVDCMPINWNIDMPSSLVVSENVACYTVEKPQQSLERTPNLYADSISVLTLSANFLLAEHSRFPEGVLVVDTHAAQFRVLFDHLSSKMKSEKIPMQRLLFPITFVANLQEGIVIVENLKLLNQMGIEIRHFGKNSFVIEALPACVENKEPVTLVQELLLEISDAKKEKEKRIICALAQRGVRKISSCEDGRVLIRELFQSQEYQTTPFGKPIYYVLTPSEMAKRLGSNV